MIEEGLTVVVLLLGIAMGVTFLIAVFRDLRR
jgi:hypothetical protein